MTQRAWRCCELESHRLNQRRLETNSGRFDQNHSYCIIHHESLLTRFTDKMLGSMPLVYLSFSTLSLSPSARSTEMYNSSSCIGYLVIRIDVLGGDEECENTACIVDIAWSSVSLSTSSKKDVPMYTYAITQ